MENGINNKIAVYWIVGTIIVIALILGFLFLSNKQKTKITDTELNSNSTTTENINSNNDSVIRPTGTPTTTPKIPTKNQPPETNFDYKG